MLSLLPFVFKGTGQHNVKPVSLIFWMATFKNEESELSFQGFAPRSGGEKRQYRPETGLLATLSDMRKKL
jgi:hypothetical protein